MPSPQRLLAAVLCTACCHAAAVTWVCGLSDDATRLVCLADADPSATPVTAAATAAVRGTAFPLDPARSWSVDLWSPPTDAAFVTQLARATICYRSPDCSIVMSRLPMLTGAEVAAR